MRRSTVLSLPFQLVFLGLANAKFVVLARPINPGSIYSLFFKLDRFINIETFFDCPEMIHLSKKRE
jgi:hypothetical protein